MNTGLLSTADEISQLAAILSQHPVIAFDTEFIRESTFYPIVEIIQVATETESWLVDAQAFKRKFKGQGAQAYDSALDPLLAVFSNPQILKIVHAAQGDQECLYTSFGRVASPTLDTAVAASLCGHGDGLGLGKLVQLVLNVTLAKGHARTNWSVRPLPQQLAEYAHSDVIHLVQLGKTLLAELEPLGRKEWALELSAKWENPALYEIDIEKMAEKLARGRRMDKTAYLALTRMLKWREDRVRYLNLPRRWVADDHVLLDLAQVRPKDLAHLSSFRGLNKGELKTSGEAILEVLREVPDDRNVVVPKPIKPLVPNAEESQVLEVLRCYVNILADQHKVAAKHLMTSHQLLPLLRSHIETKEDLVRLEILSEDAAQLVGEELLAMVHGKRALWVKENRIEVRKL